MMTTGGEDESGLREPQVVSLERKLKTPCQHILLHDDSFSHCDIFCPLVAVLLLIKTLTMKCD